MRVTDKNGSLATGAWVVPPRFTIAVASNEGDFAVYDLNREEAERLRTELDAWIAKQQQKGAAKP